MANRIETVNSVPLGATTTPMPPRLASFVLPHLDIAVNGPVRFLGDTVSVKPLPSLISGDHFVLLITPLEELIENCRSYVLRFLVCNASLEVVTQSALI